MEGTNTLGYREFREVFIENLKLNPFIEDSFIEDNDEIFDEMMPELYIRYCNDSNFSIYNGAFVASTIITYFL